MALFSSSGKFNVGDYVVAKKRKGDGESYDAGYIDDMVQYEGKVGVIKRVIRAGRYDIKGFGDWTWSDDMLRMAKEEDKPKPVVHKLPDINISDENKEVYKKLFNIK